MLQISYVVTDKVLGVLEKEDYYKRLVIKKGGDLDLSCIHYKASKDKLLLEVTC